MGLLRSISRSQRRFKMSMNVFPGDFFWITEHFVAKFGMVMQHYEPECHAENFVVVVAIFKVKVTATAHIIKMLIPWQPNLVWWYIIISQSVLWKTVGLLHSGSRSQWRVKMLMFVQVISSKPLSILFPSLVLWCIIYIMQELIWSKYDNVYCIFWTADPFATKLGLIVHYHKPECFTEILDCYVQNVNECLSTWYLLNCWTVYHQPRCVDASLWARLSFKKIGLLSLRSKS